MTATAAKLVMSADAAAEDLPVPVVFVISQSDNRANGGVESVSQVLSNLTRIRPIIVTQADSAASRRWRSNGAEVLVWPNSTARVISLIRANLRTFRLVRSLGCRVVHCNDIMALWLAAFGARLAGASVVFNVRNIKSDGQRYGWRWQIALRLSNRQLVLSQDMRDKLSARLGIRRASARAEKMSYIYSAVDTANMSAVDEQTRAGLRSRLGVAADCFAIGYVGAFEPRKGQLEFINEAGRLLKDRLPSAKVYFAGDFVPAQNDYARSCQEALGRRDLENGFECVGYKSEMADWYRAFDLVVVASRNEGLARCMIESLACGTPVVSFEVCSAGEILAGNGCGVVVAAGDYEQLVGEIVRLANDSEERRRLGDRAAALARTLFEPAKLVRQYEDMYLSLQEQ